jgi:SAM-dependent methyltransferase
MILLNVGAGGTLPGPPWVNVDFPYEHPDMPNYVRHDVGKTPLPFEDGSVDGLIACHFLEHFDCLQAVEILKDFRRALRKDGVCRIVVPDASYFRKVYPEDIADYAGNVKRLFGEGEGEGPEPLSGNTSFMQFALFFVQHKQALTEDSLWCELVQAGFDSMDVHVIGHQQTTDSSHYCAGQVAQLDNRPLFSLRMEAYK